MRGKMRREAKCLLLSGITTSDELLLSSPFACCCRWWQVTSEEGGRRWRQGGRRWYRIPTLVGSRRSSGIEKAAKKASQFCLKCYSCLWFNFWLTLFSWWLMFVQRCKSFILTLFIWFIMFYYFMLKIFE